MNDAMGAGRSVVAFVEQVESIVERITELRQVLEVLRGRPAGLSFHLQIEVAETLSGPLHFRRTRQNPLGQPPTISLPENEALVAIEQSLGDLEKQLSKLAPKLLAAAKALE